MKHFYLLCVICVIYLSACNNENDWNTITPTDNIGTLKKRSLEEAKHIATKAIDFIDSNISRSKTRTKDLDNIKFATSQNSRSSKQTATLYFMYLTMQTMLGLQSFLH